MSSHETDLECNARILVDAPVSRVFEALLSPSDVESYWGASEALITPMRGGLFVAVWGERESPHYITASRIDRLDRPRRLGLTSLHYYAQDGGPGFPVMTSTEYRLSEQDGMVLIEVEQTGFPGTDAGRAFVRACNKGWRDTLGRLKTHLENIGREA